MRRILFASVGLMLSASVQHTHIIAFEEPIDAVSVGFSTDTPSLAIRTERGWEPLVIEKEFDPLLRESNLVMFPQKVSEIALRGTTADYVVHPIRVGTDPVSYNLAALSGGGTPKVLSRRDWGADESMGLEGASVTRSDEPTNEITAGDNGPTPSQRVIDCEQAQKLYPEEFKSSAAVTTDPSGKRYRWPQRYSSSVKLLVVHHTAIMVSGDARSGAERMRALYEYHANNRGWGDVGYNFMIDETGQIYEGRNGGDYVVGGHAYCHNVGSIGIALMGNFDEEQPPQEQVKALQWLLNDLAKRYDIDVGTAIVFHGKTMQPIVRHKDLLSTDCPGYYLSSAFGQVRNNVLAGTVNSSVTFPTITVKKFVDKSAVRQAQRLEKAPVGDMRRLARINRQVRTAQRVGTSARQTLYESVRNAPADTRSAKVLPGRPTQGLQTAVSSQQSAVRTELPVGNNGGKTIRIHLTYTQNNATVSSRGGLTVNGQAVTEVRLGKEEQNCVAISNGRTVAEGIVRMVGDELTLDSKAAPFNRYAGVLECRVVDGALTMINELAIDEYMAGLSEEPDTEPYEKQKAFAIAARSYAAFYTDPQHRKFPGMPYDGDDSPARFQAYAGAAYAERNPHWAQAVADTAGLVITKNGATVKTPYFSADDGRTRTPEENGWKNFPNAEVFSSKKDPWCAGLKLAGHGVGMSGCGAEGQANEGKTYRQILEYYYPGTALLPIK